MTNTKRHSGSTMSMPATNTKEVCMLTHISNELTQSALTDNEKAVFQELIEQIAIDLYEQLTIADVAKELSEFFERPLTDFEEASNFFHELAAQESECLFNSWRDGCDMTTMYVETLADKYFRSEIVFLDYTDYLYLALQRITDCINGKESNIPATILQVTELLFMSQGVMQYCKRITYFSEIYERDRTKDARNAAMLSSVLKGQEFEIDKLLDDTGEKTIRSATEKAWDNIHTLIGKRLEQYKDSSITTSELVEHWDRHGLRIVRMMMVRYHLC